MKIILSVLSWILIILYLMVQLIVLTFVLAGIWRIVGLLTGISDVMQGMAAVLSVEILMVTVFKAHFIGLLRHAKHDTEKIMHPMQNFCADWENCGITLTADARFCPACGTHASKENIGAVSLKEQIKRKKSYIATAPAQKICSDCGMELSADLKYCPICGTYASKERCQAVNSAKTSNKLAKQEIAYLGAVGTIYFVGVLTLSLGLVPAVFNQGQENNGLYMITLGLIFLVLGFFVQRKSNAALILAIAIYGGDTLYSFLDLQGKNIVDNGFIFILILMRMILIIPMITGVAAIMALNSKKNHQKTAQAHVPRYCSYCGMKLTDHALYCSSCRTPVQNEAVWPQ